MSSDACHYRPPLCISWVFLKIFLSGNLKLTIFLSNILELINHLFVMNQAVEFYDSKWEQDILQKKIVSRYITEKNSTKGYYIKPQSICQL